MEDKTLLEQLHEDLVTIFSNIESQFYPKQTIPEYKIIINNDDCSIIINNLIDGYYIRFDPTIFDSTGETVIEINCLYFSVAISYQELSVFIKGLIYTILLTNNKLLHYSKC